MFITVIRLDLIRLVKVRTTPILSIRPYPLRAPSRSLGSLSVRQEYAEETPKKNEGPASYRVKIRLTCPPGSLRHVVDDAEETPSENKGEGILSGAKSF
jgi:hypothetical protein